MKEFQRKKIISFFHQKEKNSLNPGKDDINVCERHQKSLRKNKKSLSSEQTSRDGEKKMERREISSIKLRIPPKFVPIERRKMFHGLRMIISSAENDRKRSFESTRQVALLLRGINSFQFLHLKPVKIYF